MLKINGVLLNNAHKSLTGNRSFSDDNLDVFFPRLAFSFLENPYMPDEIIKVCYRP